MRAEFFAILLTAMVWACTAAEETVPVAEDVQVVMMRFSAVPEASVKTTLDGGTVHWDAQDRISVFDGYGHRCFTIESIRGDGSAVFVGEAVSGQPCYYACYPYRESISSACPPGHIRAASDFILIRLKGSRSRPGHPQMS